MKIDYIRKLRKEKKLLDHHVMAAAKFEKLVHSGYAGQTLNLDRVDSSPRYEPNLSGLELGKLSSQASKVLTLVIIQDKSLVSIGFMVGAKSKRSAFRRGLTELRDRLDEAYNIFY